MTRDIWVSLDEALDDLEATEKRHRNALDAFVQSTRATPYDDAASLSAQHAADLARADREVAAKLVAIYARRVADEHAEQLTAERRRSHA